MIKNDLRIPVGTAGEELHIHYRYARSGSPSPVILFSHGFTVDGTESHRLFLRMAEAYNTLGLTTVQFDYRGCGYSDGDFSRFSLTTAIEDLQTVLRWAIKQPEATPRKILVHGQSLGTAVASLAVKKEPSVMGCVLWNLSANLYPRYLAMIGGHVMQKGRAWIKAKGFEVTRDFMEDLRKYDVLSQFEDWSKPVLFVSSGSDDKGDPGLAERAAAKVGTNGSRIVIEGANHSFKCQPDLEAAAVEASLKWVRELLQ